MMNHLKLAFLFPIIIQFMFGQDSIDYKFELAGNLAYSYSNTKSPNGQFATWYDKVDVFQLQPEIGYFVIPSIEIIADFDYVLTVRRSNSFESSNNPSEPPRGEIQIKRQQHRIGSFIGCSYNIQISKAISLFMGTSLGLSVTRNIYSAQGASHYSDGTIMLINESSDGMWQEPEFSFPSFFGGMKIHLNPRWSFNLKLQYLSTTNYAGFVDDENDTFTFGIGISRYF